MYRTELKRLFLNKYLYLAVGFAIALGAIGFISYYQDIFFHKQTGNIDSISAFEGWLFTIALGQSSVLKLVIPLLVSLPFSDSYLYDKKSGHYQYLVVRGGKKNYFKAKLVTNAFAGAFVIFTSFSILFLISCFLFPLNVPNTELNYSPGGLFSEFYRVNPFIYLLLITFLATLFGAIYATIGFGASSIFNNRLATLTFPFLVYLTLIIVSQVLNIKHLFPVALIAPFSIHDANISVILTGFSIATALAIVLLVKLQKLEQGEFS